MFQKDIVHRSVIHYLHFQRSLRKVARIYHTSASSLSRWVRKLASKQDDVCITSQPSIKRRISSISLLIQQTILKNPFQTLEDIVRQLLAAGVRSSKSSVHRHLRRMRFSRKRATHKFSPKQPSPEDANKFLEQVQNAPEVVSIDESSVCLESLPLFGYTLKGTRACKRSRKPPRGNRVTLLLAISNVGIFV
jgi:transposase